MNAKKSKSNGPSEDGCDVINRHIDEIREAARSVGIDFLVLEEGIERIFELADAVKQKPAVIGIYGHKSAGKTHLRKILFNTTLRKRLRANAGLIENERSYVDFTDPDYIFVEDFIFATKGGSRDLYPIQFVGKPMDYAVLIVNPSLRDFNGCKCSIMTAINDKDYDLIIHNPKSYLEGEH